MAIIADILKRGCWKSQNTFTKFFSKDISNEDNSRKDFGLFQASPWKIENPQIVFIYLFIFIYTD